MSLCRVKVSCVLIAALAAAAWAQGPNASPQALAAGNAFLENNARALGLTNVG